MNLPSRTLNLLILATSILVVPDSLAKKGGNGGGGGGGNGGGGADPDFTAASADPVIPAIGSYSLDTGGQIVFRNAQMDLFQFEGILKNGDSCNHWDLNYGSLNDGTLVLKPKSSNNPTTAVLSFWFQSVLESGDTVMHLFTMEGEFDAQDDWPPSVENPVTAVMFNYWEVAAENKKAQRQDCAGELPDNSSSTWSVTVTRQP